MDSEAKEFVAGAVCDAREPVVVFALEWCEFCWSARKLLKLVDVPYRAVELDSVAYQKDMLGRRIRNALTERTAIETIPQIFIGGELVGGCTDLFDGWRSGSVQALLDRSGVEYSRDKQVDPYTLLPGWLHPR
jgi:cysteine synthase A